MQVSAHWPFNVGPARFLAVSTNPGKGAFTPIAAVEVRDALFQSQPNSSPI
jgi:hypothetical protein